MTDIAGVSIPPVLLSQDRLYQYYDYPVEFVEDQILAPHNILNRRNVRPSLDQQSVLKEFVQSNRIGIESGHGTGKSTMFTWIAIFFMVTRYNNLGRTIKIPCIAPTYHQLFDILWSEFAVWLPSSRVYPLFVMRQDLIYLVGQKKTAFMQARSPQEPDNLQGFHADHLLWIADEAFNIVREEAWDHVEGSLTRPDNKIVFGGQHSVVVGYCHDAFHKDAADWRTFRFSSADSPIADPKYALRIERKYGRNSDVYRIRVEGKEPLGNPRALIQMSRTEAARNRDTKPKGALRMGVDCARDGDDLSVVTIAQGMHVFPQEVEPKSDSFSLYELTINTLRKYRAKTGYKGKTQVRIDMTGGYGAGLYDLLVRNTDDNIEPIGINFGGGGDDESSNIVSAMWAALERQIDDMQLPDDDFLIEEVGTRRVKGYDKDGRMIIEPKKEYKKEYGQSPDRSDSLVLCVYTEHWRKRVWDYFGRDVMIPMKVAWHNKQQKEYNLHYGAVVLGEDMSLTVLCTMWDRRRGYLYVYDGFKTNDPAPVALIPKLMSKMHLKDFVTDKILGSANMFGDGARPVAKQINQAFKEARLPEHRIKPATKWDEYGSMVDVGQLFKLRRIYIRDTLDDVAQDIEYWFVDKGEPTPTPGYCRCLELISSELRKAREIQRVLVPQFRDYNKRELVQQVYGKTGKGMRV